MTERARTSKLLERSGVAHAFFTRNGGVSTGVYASLNGGVGSRDAAEKVAENRRRMADELGVGAGRLLIPYQIHSAEVVTVDRPWEADERPRCDAIVTTERGLAIGVTGADCGMILLQDVDNGVVGAAHAGWRGAIGGVLEATVDRMADCGARRSAIIAALGPTIAAASYEVGDEFRQRFGSDDPESLRFFQSAGAAKCFRFDLPAYIRLRLERARIGAFDDLALDTYARDDLFFSYRRSLHRSEEDYGRLVSAIVLK